MTARDSVALRIDQVTKRFPGVTALDGVSFEVDRGEVHALVGENGAGKSTLMAIAAGSTLPEEGSVEIGGRSLDPATPARARELGLAIVHQHPAVLPDLNVVENLLLSVGSAHAPSMRGTRAWAREQLKRVGLEVDPRKRVGELSVADRHLLEIAKALAANPSVLILDEPTEPLLAQEIERLFELVYLLTAEGAAVVYISHRLPEVKRIADRITVLRDGATKGTFAAGGVSEDEILQRIVGRPVDSAFPQKQPASAQGPILKVEGISGDGFHDVSFAVRPGEIVGLAGVEGNGQREILRGLAGFGSVRGRISIDGRQHRLGSTARARDAGVAYLPADRHGEGLMLSLSVQENAGLLSLGRHSSAGILRRSAEATEVAEMATALAVKTPSLEVPVSTLSGGNQQKIVLGRALLAEPRVLLADEPTQGVDLGARLEIYRILRSRAEQGVAIVVVSSDAVELAGLCDRVLVCSRGQVVSELTGDGLDENAITESALLSTSLRHRDEDGRGWLSRLRGLFKSDLGPSLILALAILGLGAVTAAQNERFLTEANISGLLLLLSAIAFISLGQLVVLMIGAIDLSVGPLSGFLVVIASFYATQGASGLDLTEAILLMLGAAILVGSLNALMSRWLRMGPVIATLVSYIVLQGFSLLLRETPEGYIDSGFTTVIKTKVGGVPVAILVVVAVALALELALRRTRWGMTLRAVGSNESAAHQLGINVSRTVAGAFVLCSVLVFVGAVMLMAQIGVGDPTAGVNYTLSSITAVVLGGASIFGGRGSFVGALLGAALIQVVLNATTFLTLGQEWQYWLLGLLTIVAAAIYSRGRAALET